MQEAIKQEAPLKVLDFSDDADHKQDESGNFTVAFVPLDSRVLFLWYQKKALIDVALFLILRRNFPNELSKFS